MKININPLHFESLPSTQEYLLNLIEEDSCQSNNSILITARSQTAGFGRTGNQWEHLPNGLAMSFIVDANKASSTITLLEIAILISRFIKESFQQEIKLKWPNDLMITESKKVGGLIATIREKRVCIGLGINLGANISRPFVTNQKFNDDQLKKIAETLYSYILTNRIQITDLIIKEFIELSIHINRQVLIVDNNKKYSGIFKTIGPNGEAIINGKKIFNGSLFIQEKLKSI